MTGEQITGPAQKNNVRADAGGAIRKNLVGLIFSKDRAMQLQATLESFLIHCRDSADIQLFVLYKGSNSFYQGQYDKLGTRFTNISFAKETCFNEQVLTLMEGFEHVLFLVDDNLFVNDFYLADVVKNLRGNNDAIGFSLRLGRNTIYCYPKDIDQQLPVFQKVGKGIVKYDWTTAEFDFGYPLEVSSSVYRTIDLLVLLKKMKFANPNVLEDMMSANVRLYAKARRSLLCYEYSVTFCSPINKVQSVWENRAGTDPFYATQRLAEMFEKGYAIDVGRYSNFVSNACHQEVPVHFKQTAATPEEKTTAKRQLKPKSKFSVVMANYNNAGYVAQAIESLLNQTFEPWELIIVEDCSTDNSVEVIKPYLSDNRIRLIRHESNRGYTAALKTGIANLRSDYFGILDSDDSLPQQAVETMYRCHIAHPDAGFIYSQFMYCHEELTPKRIGFCAEIPPGKTSLDENVVSHFKTFKLCDYLKTSGYDENILYAEDIDIIYKMEEVTNLKFVDACLYLYRELPNSVCHSKSKVNVAIMSRVKARINAIKRRCSVRARSENQSFEKLFREAIHLARNTHEDVAQYFILLKDLYEKGFLNDLTLPQDMERLSSEDKILWLAANINMQFDKLFGILDKNLHSTGAAKGQP